MAELIHDLRVVLRRLRRAPGFTAIVVLTLALGIGANVAVFSVLDAVVLRPLQVGEPEHLVAVWETAGDDRKWPMSPWGFSSLRRESDAFDGLSLVQPAGFNLTAGDTPQRVRGARVSASFFELLRVQPARGRWFTAADDLPGAAPSVVVSHGFWRRRLGGDDTVVGSAVELDGVAHTVVGVTPPRMRFPLPEDAELWVPRPLAAGEEESRRHSFVVIGRLAAGTALEQASDAAGALATRLAEQGGPQARGLGFALVPLHEQLVGKYRFSLVALWIAVGLVLLVACVNVANLLLARGSGRRAELALRSALGAGRRRLARLLLTESAVLGGLGALAGLLVVPAVLWLLGRLGTDTLPRQAEIGLDPRLVLLTLGLALVTGLLFGLAPALEAVRSDPAEALGEVRSMAGGVQHGRLRSLLVMAESALVTVLLTAAGLTLVSVYALGRVDPGFAVEDRWAVRVELPAGEYPSPARVAGFLADLEERVGALPGVRSAAGATTLPLDPAGLALSLPVLVEGAAPMRPDEAPVAAFRGVTPGYFDTLEISLLRGRLFTPADRGDAPGVLVVNRSLAEQLWPGADPVGARVQVVPGGPMLTVVGVVSEVKHQGLEAESGPEMFQPHAQLPLPFRTVQLVVHAAGSAPLIPALRSAVAAVDPRVPVAEVVTLAEARNRSIAQPRMRSALLAVFALLAVTLAAVGVYGVVSYTVSRTTREIGLRMAVGADRSSVLRRAVFGALRPMAAGLAVGLVAALAGGRWVESWLFGVSAWDPRVLAAVALLLLLLGLAASALPARRATRVDPATLLRSS